MIRIQTLIAVMLLALGPTAVMSQDIPGQTDLAYIEATEAWLSGEDDLAALQALSALAHDNNVAAQVLLARIAQSVHIVAHVTDDMARADRIALLRRPGGLSGRNWMEAAAETLPLAQAFLGIAVLADRAASIQTLFEAGEIAAGTRSLPGLLAAGPDYGLALLQGLDAMPDEARILMASMLSEHVYWTSGQQIDIPDPLQSRTPPELALIWRPVYPADWRDQPELRDIALEASPRIASLAPILDLCKQACADDVALCTATGASLLALFASPFPFASPSESLISTEDYWDSPRFDADSARILRAFVSPEFQASRFEMSACFVEMATAP